MLGLLSSVLLLAQDSGPAAPVSPSAPSLVRPEHDARSPSLLDLFFPRDINLLTPQYSSPMEEIHLEAGDPLFEAGESAIHLTHLIAEKNVADFLEVPGAWRIGDGDIVVGCSARSGVWIVDGSHGRPLLDRTAGSARVLAGKSPPCGRRPEASTGSRATQLRTWCHFAAAGLSFRDPRS